MKYDKWLSKILGYDAFVYEKGGWGIGKLRRALLSLKLDVGERFDFWVICGFDYVTTELTFERKPKILVQLHETEEPLPEYHEQILNLAETGFSEDRFHKDKNIPTQIANKIKKEWIRSYLNNKRGETLLVSVNLDGKIRGFLAPMVKDNIAIIDLVAVHEDFRQQGIGLGLVRTFMTRYNNCKGYRVGTQITNIPSIRMYEKCGFRMTSAKHIFHKHVGG